MVVRAWWAGLSLCCHPAGVVPDAFKRIVAQGKNVLCTALGGCGAQFPAGRLPKNWERGTCWYGKCKAQQEDL